MINQYNIIMIVHYTHKHFLRHCPQSCQVEHHPLDICSNLVMFFLFYIRAHLNQDGSVLILRVTFGYILDFINNIYTLRYK